MESVGNVCIFVDMIIKCGVCLLKSENGIID